MTNIAAQLIGKTVHGLARAVVCHNESRLEQQDTLIITLSCDTRVELIVRQDAIVVKELYPDEAPIVDFALEPGERVCLVAITNVDVPFFIEGILEVWAREGAERFPVGLIFMDSEHCPRLSLCTETDEFEMLEYVDLRNRLDQMVFDYGIVEYRWFEATQGSPT